MSKSLILLLVLQCALAFCPCALAGNNDFSRTRHKSALLALLCYNPIPALAKNFTCKRIQKIAILKSYVQEGGYIPQRIRNILSIADPEVEHLQLIINELDGKNSNISKPNVLELSSSVALSYSRPSISGLRAAVHISRLVSVDNDCDKIAKATYSLLVYTLEGEVTDKQELIKICAVNADDDLIARKIRSVRLSDWHKLPPEKTLIGRFCRVLYIWQRYDNWAECMSAGRKLLRYTESLQFLATLSAASLDLPRLPENFIWKSLQEKEIRDLSIELYDLAAEGILVPVDKKLIEQDRNQYCSSSKESVNGKPLTPAADEETAQSDDTPAMTPATPALPATPQAPSMPGVSSAANVTAKLPPRPKQPQTIPAWQKQSPTYAEIAPIQPLGEFPTE